MSYSTAFATDQEPRVSASPVDGRAKVITIDPPPRFRQLWAIQRWFGRPLFCIGISIAGIFLDIPLLPERQFFVSHLLLIGLILALVVRGLAVDASAFQRFTLALLSVFGLSLLSSFYHGVGSRLGSDTSKLLIYAFGVYSLSRLLTADQLVTVLRAVPFVIAAYCLSEIAFAEDVFAVSGRLALENTGSSNTVGAMLAVSLLPVFLADYERVPKLVVVGAGLVLLTLLVLSFSRASIIGLGVACAVSIPKRRLIVLVPLGLVGALIVASLFLDLNEFAESADVLRKANLIDAVMERRSVNRLNIWSTLLTHYAETPTAWLFGFGPGSVEYYVPSFTAYLNQSKYLYSPHSNFIGALYYFGIVGFAAFTAFLWKTYRVVQSRSSYKRLKSAIMWFYIVTFALDSHLLSSQGMFIHTMFLAFLLSSSTHEIAKQRLAELRGQGLAPRAS